MTRSMHLVLALALACALPALTWAQTPPPPAAPSGATAASVSSALTDTKPAVAAAEKWLALVDAGKYEESWNQSSEFFRSKIKSSAWAQMIAQARKPYGKIAARVLTVATFTTTVPGAPVGQFVLLQYKSNSPSSSPPNSVVTETVTPRLDKDGVWRVSGYFIH